MKYHLYTALYFLMLGKNRGKSCAWAWHWACCQVTHFPLCHTHIPFIPGRDKVGSINPNQPGTWAKWSGYLSLGGDLGKSTSLSDYQGIVVAPSGLWCLDKTVCAYRQPVIFLLRPHIFCYKTQLGWRVLALACSASSWQKQPPNRTKWFFFRWCTRTNTAHKRRPLGISGHYPVI